MGRRGGKFGLSRYLGTEEVRHQGGLAGGTLSGPTIDQRSEPLEEWSFQGSGGLRGGGSGVRIAMPRDIAEADPLSLRRAVLKKFGPFLVAEDARGFADTLVKDTREVVAISEADLGCHLFNRKVRCHQELPSLLDPDLREELRGLTSVFLPEYLPQGSHGETQRFCEPLDGPVMHVLLLDKVSDAFGDVTRMRTCAHEAACPFEQLGRSEGFIQVVVGPGPHARDDDLFRAIATNQQNGNVTALADGAQEIESALLAEDDVQND